MMRASREGSPIWAYVALAVVAGVLPLVVDSAYYLSVLILVGIYGLMAVGLSLLMGYAGQVSLGHAAFYGLGAYATAIGTVRYGLNPWLCILLGMLVTAAVAYVIGRPTLRLHGHYLAMATLGIGIIVQIFFREGGKFTGGFSGIAGIPRLHIGSLVFNTDMKFCYVVWPVVILGLIVASNIVSSRIGRALRAIHDSEVAARACGVDVSGLKLSVFVLSAVFASVSGSLYAHNITFISPDPFGFAFSIMLVVMVIVGGSGSVWGALSGAAILTVLNQALMRLGEVVPALSGLDVVFFGGILIVTVVFMPEGLAGRIRRWRTGRDVEEAAEEAV